MRTGLPRRAIALLAMMILLSTPAFAAQCDYECTKPYDMSKGKILTSVTGANFCAQKVAQSIARKIIKKSAKVDNLKVKIKSFSPMDLAAGRFKALEIKGKNFDADGIYLSALEIKTLCNFNYAVPDDKNKTVVFKEDLPLSLHVELSEDDLNKTMQTVGYDRLIEDLNRVAAKAGVIKIIDTQVKIKNDKFIYVVKTAVPLVKKPQTLVLTSDLTIKNGNIKFTDTKLMNNSIMLDLSKASYLLNFLNPLDYSMQILENKNAKMKITDVTIKDNKIIADGIVVIPKG
jgi:hypothetical protein